VAIFSIIATVKLCHLGRKGLKAGFLGCFWFLVELFLFVFGGKG
jgi:hypothetical protein